MKHAFSKGLISSKFWRTCRSTLVERILSKILSIYKLGIIWNASTMIDGEITSFVSVSDDQVNIIINTNKE